jgi:hypothetical protein
VVLVIREHLHGIVLDADTVRKWLKQAAEFLPVPNDLLATADELIE